jgi:hypothetical protein
MRWHGSFQDVLKASSGSLSNFSNELRTFRAFDDPLFKLTMLLAILLTGSGLAAFDHPLLPAVDYHLMKQLLRFGVLIPSARISAALIRRDLLATDDAFEIRAAAIEALAEVSYRTGISGDRLDNFLWRNRSACSDERPACTDSSRAGDCPLVESCLRKTQFFRPLELTRYY